VSLQQSLKFPLPDNYIVNIQIRIQPHDREYQAYIQTDYSDWYSFPIHLKQDDLQELNKELQEKIEQLSGSFNVERANVTECNESLQALAKKGSYAFNKIFDKGTPRDVLREALKEGAIIQVTSEDFFIPWELLYDGHLGDQVDANCFWGMRYIITRTLTREARPGDFALPVMSSHPHVGIIACNELEYVATRELPALQRLEQQERIHLFCLRPLDPNQHGKELRDFGQFLSGELHIMHLACHACVKESVSESYLMVSQDFIISMEDFTIGDFEFRHKPLVLLNACLSGTISPLHTSNWAVLFWKLGAKGVLATEFRVPDWFAAMFIEEIYNQLLSRKPIGEALLLARRHFLHQQNNPLGLGYALYSRPSIRIASEEVEKK
jgi:hypothetical protein